MNGYPSFPITPFLDEIVNDLKNSKSRFMILSAETAAGKSTVLPLALIDSFTKENQNNKGQFSKLKILMTEPRRIAVLGVASRLAQLRGEETGNSVGYKIHLESKISDNTKLEVVTEAVLVRMLQSDPFLEGYSVVVLDEFHERSVNTDLALAFLKETMEARDDLYVIVMSATMNMEKLKAYLGQDVVVKNIPGMSFPVEEIYAPGVAPEDAVLNELKVKTESGQNNVLVFLPGIYDIRKCQKTLENKLLPDTELLILHSSITLEDQKKVLSPSSSKNRVILSSAIAETSLTVPGITSVIDSGLCRINRINTATGMTTLVTETESEFSARQRKGRAGRVQKGRCIRLWNSIEPRVKESLPEILRTDLCSVILECSERGITNLESLNFLDNPKPHVWKQSSELLRQLKFINYDGSITQKGKAALTLALEPRLAGIALTAGISNFPKVKNLLLKYSSYGQSSKEMQNRFLSDIERRLSNTSDFSEKIPDSLLILSGFPDRLARRISAPGEPKALFRLASGRMACLKEQKNNVPLWIVVTEAKDGSTQALVYEWEEILESEINSYLESHAEKKIECSFENGKVVKFENLCFGKIILNQKKLQAEKEDLINAWIGEVENRGFESLPVDEKIQRFIIRAKFYKKYCLGQSVEEFENSLCHNVSQWLPPFMAGATKLTAEILFNALYWFLEGSSVDEKVPETMTLSNNAKVKIKYEMVTVDGELTVRPIIEVIIQRIFGIFKTPEVCGKKVLLRLLSPASRPLQVTDDLENFWTNTWPEICKEMKGRYPKHNWDYRQFVE